MIAGDLIDTGVAEGVIDKSGSWYAYEGERIGQGRENVKRFLKENPDICEKAMAQVRQSLGLANQPEEEKQAEEAS